jgi:Putative restriction endonuclease
MVKHIEDEVKYYYDSHPTEEDLMGEAAVHAALVHYLVEVLTWMFKGQVCAIYENLNIYQTSNRDEYPLAPDVAVLKGITYQFIRSWRVGKSGPAPQVVFEIASEETWAKDLDEKPGKYARMGVQEYFAYDPNDPLLLRSRTRRLFGWQLDLKNETMLEMKPMSNRVLWSAQLESWLVPDGAFLRLYDKSGQVRLTGVEAEARRANFHLKQAEAETKRAQALADKLRSLGVDPDQLI